MGRIVMFNLVSADGYVAAPALYLAPMCFLARVIVITPAVG